jgi:hypothetical protein
MVGRRIFAFIDRMSLGSQVTAAIGALIAILAVGTIGFHYLERDWNWIEAFYFSTYTLTTVGYGDYTPTSDASRLCASFYMIVGVTIALGAMGIIGSKYISRREEAVIHKYEAAKARQATKNKDDPDEETLGGKD